MILLNSLILRLKLIYFSTNPQKSIVYPPVMHHLFYQANLTFLSLLWSFGCLFEKTLLEIAGSQFIPLLLSERLSSFKFKREKHVS